jgi:hypothetical protein
LLGGEFPAGEDIGEPGFVVLERDDPLNARRFNEPNFEEVAARDINGPEWIR